MTKEMKKIVLSIIVALIAITANAQGKFPILG